MIPVNDFYMFTVMTLGVHSHQEEIRGLKPTQAHCSLQSPFCGSVGFYTGLGLPIYALLLGMVQGWELDGTILLGPFQFILFCDSLIVSC